MDFVSYQHANYIHKITTENTFDYSRIIYSREKKTLYILTAIHYLHGFVVLVSFHEKQSSHLYNQIILR